jgi:hypothetical protein
MKVEGETAVDVKVKSNEINEVDLVWYLEGLG